MKSEVENVLATQQNQMPVAWNVESTLFVFVLSFVSEAHAGSITSTVVDVIYSFFFKLIYFSILTGHLNVMLHCVYKFVYRW